MTDKGPAQQKHIFPVNNAGSGNKILKHNSTTGQSLATTLKFQSICRS